MDGLARETEEPQRQNARRAVLDHAAWNHRIRGENDVQRVDRNFLELLQELRVAQTGVQILFAFLLGLAFTPRFPTLSDWQHGVYLATLLCSAAAAGLLIAGRWATAEEGRPRLVILTGDAGVGKTRLSWELENYLDGLSATVLWHRGRCLAYGEGVGFSALASAIRGRIGASEDDPEQATRAKLTASLEEHVPDADERAWLYPAVANLLGFGASSAMTREELFSAWLTWFERLPSEPGDSIVWVVDDAQHADDGLLDFIQHVSTVAQVGVLIVLMARPELLGRRPELAALRRANVVGLETLSRADMAGLFDGLVEGLPEDVRKIADTAWFKSLLFFDPAEVMKTCATRSSNAPRASRCSPSRRCGR